MLSMGVGEEIDGLGMITILGYLLEDYRKAFRFCEKYYYIYRLRILLRKA
jgi:hypothetical protein